MQPFPASEPRRPRPALPLRGCDSDPKEPQLSTNSWKVYTPLVVGMRRALLVPAGAAHGTLSSRAFKVAAVASSRAMQVSTVQLSGRDGPAAWASQRGWAWRGAERVRGLAGKADKDSEQSKEAQAKTLAAIRRQVGPQFSDNGWMRQPNSRISASLLLRDPPMRPLLQVPQAVAMHVPQSAHDCSIRLI